MRDVSSYHRSLWNSLFCAGRGLFFAVYSQRNMRIHLGVGMLAFGMGVFFGLSTLEWMILVMSAFIVIVSETINTAIELNVDLVTRQRKLRAMLAKDVAAGAVLLSVVQAVVVGYLLFFDRFVTLWSGG